MAEVFGQRSLLGFGVVLAWLVLFHLLVNIWLLCVFTSLLVVLGGWLGSQAVLESDSVIHLERFITLEQVPTSVEDDHHLDQEIHNTVKKIIRDFVTSWYSTVSYESGFETEVQEAMISMAMELKMRAKQVDRKELLQKILDLFGCHLQDYIRAKELVSEQQTPMITKWSSESQQLWKAYFRVTTPHVAMTSDTVELNYTRAVVDLLLHVLVPLPHLETRTGRFVVGELINCNVLLPFIAKLSDPDWLNILMIEILGQSSKPQEPITTETLTSSPPITQPLAESELAPLKETTQVPQKYTEIPQARAETEIVHETEMPEVASCDVFDSKGVDCPQNNTEEQETTRPFLDHYIRGSKLNPFYQENDSDLDSPLADYKQSSTDSLVMIGQEEGVNDIRKECTTSAENNNGVDLADVCPCPVDGSCRNVLVNSEHPNGYSPSSAEGTPSITSLQDLERERSSPLVNPTRDLLLGVEQTGLGNPNDLTVVSPLQGSSPMPSFSFEPLSSPDGPVIIQNLRITGTITAKEHRGTGSHPYTLYTIKYETAMGCENPGSIQPGSEDAEVVQTSCENPSPIQPVAYHMVNRRYSEFLNLQTRLEEKTELRKLIKGVKGPKKIFPDMPFGNMDTDKIEARKGLLETFLKQLCAIPEIANSEEMQEFLALNTDARIAFVKKPFIGSRIDKIVVNAIVDTLKTAFPRSEPQSPTEDFQGEMDGGKIIGDKKSKSRLKFSSKNIPSMNGSDIRPSVLFSLEQTSTVFNRMSLQDLQAFITEQEKQAVRSEQERDDSPVVREFSVCLDDSLRGNQSREHASETALAEVALNILCLLMKEQWSWLCTENIQRTIRLLFGTLINRAFWRIRRLSDHLPMCFGSALGFRPSLMR
ncbi:sorting nexin-19-like isoform X2 [Xiphias gladius]|uniref:sorting nexin-19-like isoform X2 n=1 Tax=Xiphias gladius TaxID=8245 RepID=UPI001A99EC6D|nr:sorting nexin-19-like isoform X2 [Xiphias gladius]